MITKTVLITMLTFSATFSPVHEAPVPVMADIDIDPAEVTVTPVMTNTHSFTVYKIDPSDIISRNIFQDKANPKITIEGGKSYEQCLRESIELACGKINSSLFGIQKPEETPIDIIE